MRIAQRWSADPGAPGSFYETFEWIPAATWTPPATSPTVPAPGCVAVPEQLAANKQVAAEFWRSGITPVERIALVDEAYVQHNPRFRRYALENKVSDYQTLIVMATRAGVVEAERPIVAGGRTLTPNRFEHVIAACDIVTQVHKSYAERPAGSGNWVERFSWDTFRVRNGKLVEHWDDTDLPAPRPSAPSASKEP